MDLLELALRTAKIEVFAADESLEDRISKLVDRKLCMVEPARGDVLRAILWVVRKRGVQTVVVEDEYVDADYLETYAEHYSRAFRTKGSLCTRLHFFRCNLDRQGLFTLPIRGARKLPRLLHSSANGSPVRKPNRACSAIPVRR